MSKLHIDLKNGTLEVEGEESFIDKIYQDFKTRLLVEAPLVKKPEVSSDISTAPTSGGSPKVVPARSKVKRAKESFSIVKDLDLSAKVNGKSLKDFYSEKAPATSMECNVVFVYFLQQILKVPVITLNHVYSCYKDAGVKVPSLRQSIADTSSRRGWLETKSFDDIKLAIPGENFVEHELPHMGKK